jgi:hypothetical protein
MIHLCFFGEGLDRMKKKDQGSPRKVLRVLHGCKRFSVFEATENQKIAHTMQRLKDEGYIEVDNSPGYPWSNVALTPKGFALMEDV